MKIDDEQLFSFMQTTKEALGRIEANQGSQLAYIQAVSAGAKKIAEDLGDHLRSDDAHGAGGERRAHSNAVAWLAMALTILGFLFTQIPRLSAPALPAAVPAARHP